MADLLYFFIFDFLGSASFGRKMLQFFFPCRLCLLCFHNIIVRSDICKLLFTRTFLFQLVGKQRSLIQ